MWNPLFVDSQQMYNNNNNNNTNNNDNNKCQKFPWISINYFKKKTYFYEKCCSVYNDFDALQS